MTLASCGVRPTPVLTGAEAPTVSSYELTVYFVTAEGNGLVRRTRPYTGNVDTTTSMNLLLRGLTDEEKKLGLRTDVPTSSSSVHVVERLILLPEDVPLSSLGKWGVYQVYCTALAGKTKVEGLPSTGYDCP
ncbi:hypothetical protein [Lentzea kentuckyensis]|uniref:hypothetical protein n=1 Tax=Lentzea kentuckyensis TaxID=360086 RepID=UPI000A392CF1|nr:hypothetical protein [Lentzea kentuckyensis]